MCARLCVARKKENYVKFVIQNRHALLSKDRNKYILLKTPQETTFQNHKYAVSRVHCRLNVYDNH